MRRVALVVVALAAVGIYAPAIARTSSAKLVTVAHGPVTALNSQYIDLGAPGPSVGDVRTYYIPLTQSNKPVGYLTGTLTTVAVDRPAASMELRTSNLVYVIGKASDQIVLGGVAAYAQSAPSVSARSVVTRPVIGGSGRYAGARGWCVTTHFADNTWTHVFHLTY
jgi:ABC-type Co2+ transport system permease subunit